jgi:hypothetical protein
MKLLLCLSIIFICPIVQATVRIPEYMDEQGERQTALKILGLGMSTKFLSNPYPLGGYSGFEFGVSIETLSAEDLSSSISVPAGEEKPAPQKEISYPKISIGKGLYNNVDIFWQFIPYNQNTELSQHGGILKWSFYQADFLPLSLSAMVHANSTNISNKIVTRTVGADVIMGMNVNSFALYFGGGPIKSKGHFVAAVTNSSVNDTENSEQTESVSAFHTVVGANLRIASTFLAVEIDRYVDPVYSAKLGVRY